MPKAGPDKPLDDLDDSSILRMSIAVFIALTGAAVIWITTPYNDYLLRNTHISEGYLPVAALALTLILVLGVNPLLRRIRSRLALRRGQLAFILGVLLVASVIPAYGLMRMLPYTIADIPHKVNIDKVQSEDFGKMGLPEALFPDKLGHGLPTPASDGFINQLLPDEQVPWAAWLGPLWSWGLLLLFAWLMMIGLAMIVLPQWRHHERLAFPLLRIHETLIEPPEAGRLLPPLFRQRAFWIAAVAVLVLRLMAELNRYLPESVPAVPLEWDVRSLFAEPPWVHLPRHAYIGSVRFLLIGIAFFMPNRISFSIWSVVLIYFGYQMIGTSYLPPFHYNTIREHRLGTLIALSIGIVWIGRQRWGHVFASLVRKARDASDRQARVSGAMFTLGCVGMFAWLVWVGVQPGFAVIFTAFAFMVSLVMSRMVAETGLPFIRIRSELMRVVRFFPVKIVSATSICFAVIMGILFTVTSRMNTAAISTHALALTESQTRPKRSRMAFLMIGLLALGFVVSGAVHVNMNYHNATSLDGNDQPLNTWAYMWIADAYGGVKDLRTGQTSTPTYSRGGHLALGIGMAAVLLGLCWTTPRWPLHPIGLLFAGTWIGGEMWPSILIGWALKTLMVRYGGTRLYRKARPFFLGLILGEVFAVVAWTLVPVILTALGQPYLRPPTALF